MIFAITHAIAKIHTLSIYFCIAYTYLYAANAKLNKITWDLNTKIFLVITLVIEHMEVKNIKTTTSNCDNNSTSVSNTK